MILIPDKWIKLAQAPVNDKRWFSSEGEEYWHTEDAEFIVVNCKLGDARMRLTCKILRHDIVLPDGSLFNGETLTVNNAIGEQMTDKRPWPYDKAIDLLIEIDKAYQVYVRKNTLQPLFLELARVDRFLKEIDYREQP